MKSRFTYVVHSSCPVSRSRQTNEPAYVVTQTRPPKTDGLALMRPPVWYAQRMRPECALTANTRPSCDPKYTVPSTTTGDDSTFPAVWTRHRSWPDSRSRAVTVPSCEATRTRGPSIAGLDGSVPPTLRR